MSAVIVLAMLIAARAPIADERRMSPAEVERILEEAARKRVAAEKPPARAIEGEVGVSVGSGGYREVLGSAVVPVGQDATAIFSIGGEDSNRPKRRR